MTNQLVTEILTRRQRLVGDIEKVAPGMWRSVPKAHTDPRIKEMEMIKEKNQLMAQLKETEKELAVAVALMEEMVHQCLECDLFAIEKDERDG